MCSKCRKNPKYKPPGGGPLDSWCKMCIRNETRRSRTVPPSEYQRMVQFQDNKCAICSNTETVIDARRDRVRKLAIDHDHATGKVRGLLCSSCNNGLGRFKDSPELLKKAVEYLEYHNQRA